MPVADLLRALLIACTASVPVIVQATRYEVPAGADLGEFVAQLPADATYLALSKSARYTSKGDIVLPDGVLLIIDGCGATLELGVGSHGFTRRIKDQADAMKKVSSRYAIRDFAAIEGGLKAIDLQATLGSTVTNCRLIGQSVAAVDLRFCLMARLQNVLATNPKGQGFVIRTGDWPGANWNNSQSNSTVLEQCRVYSSGSTTNAFAVLNSGGVRMLDCVSEGAVSDRDIYLAAVTDGNEERLANNTVVKSFTLHNFHVEHKVRLESIHVNMPNQATVDLSNIYWNGKPEAPVIRYLRGQLNLSDIGWWSPDLRIVSRVTTPRINATRCHSQLRPGDKSQRTATRAGSFELADPFPGHTRLDLTYVRVSAPSR
ncbi:MAG: hypothetical protein KDC00_05555 [Flavobacteriales bacterium]|nr:hypothetical protein [Flavobacteriales bacterium]